MWWKWDGLWLIVGVGLPLTVMGVYCLWKERQAEKYKEWVKEHGEPEEATQG